MSKYVVDSSELVAVADAIRSKTGDSSGLTFPTGMVNAIDSMSSGGDYVGDASVAKRIYEVPVKGVRSGKQGIHLGHYVVLKCSPYYASNTARPSGVDQRVTYIYDLDTQQISHSYTYPSTQFGTGKDISFVEYMPGKFIIYPNSQANYDTRGTMFIWLYDSGTDTWTYFEDADCPLSSYELYPTSNPVMMTFANGAIFRFASSASGSVNFALIDNTITVLSRDVYSSGAKAKYQVSLGTYDGYEYLVFHNENRVYSASPYIIRRYVDTNVAQVVRLTLVRGNKSYSLTVGRNSRKALAFRSNSDLWVYDVLTQTFEYNFSINNLVGATPLSVKILNDNIVMASNSYRNFTAYSHPNGVRTYNYLDLGTSTSTDQFIATTRDIFVAYNGTIYKFVSDSGFVQQVSGLGYSGGLCSSGEDVFYIPKAANVYTMWAYYGATSQSETIVSSSQPFNYSSTVSPEFYTLFSGHTRISYFCSVYKIDGVYHFFPGSTRYEPTTDKVFAVVTGYDISGDAKLLYYSDTDDLFIITLPDVTTTSAKPIVFSNDLYYVLIADNALTKTYFIKRDVVNDITSIVYTHPSNIIYQYANVPSRIQTFGTAKICSYSGVRDYSFARTYHTQQVLNSGTLYIDSATDTIKIFSQDYSAFLKENSRYLCLYAGAALSLYDLVNDTIIATDATPVNSYAWAITKDNKILYRTSTEVRLYNIADGTTTTIATYTSSSTNTSYSFVVSIDTWTYTTGQGGTYAYDSVSGTYSKISTSNLASSSYNQNFYNIDGLVLYSNGYSPNFAWVDIANAPFTYDVKSGRVSTLLKAGIYYIYELSTVSGQGTSSNWIKVSLSKRESQVTTHICDFPGWPLGGSVSYAYGGLYIKGNKVYANAYSSQSQPYTMWLCDVEAQKFMTYVSYTQSYYSSDIIVSCAMDSKNVSCYLPYEDKLATKAISNFYPDAGSTGMLFGQNYETQHLAYVFSQYVTSSSTNSYIVLLEEDV